MSVILGFVLLIDVGWVDLVYVIVDFKLGIIGVGIKVKLIMYYFNVSDNFKVYGLKFYCYIVEIQEQLFGFWLEFLQVQFMFYLLLVDWGILFIIYIMFVWEEVSDQAIRKLYEDFYVDVFFVWLCKILFILKDVWSFNFCDIFMIYDEWIN